MLLLSNTTQQAVYNPTTEKDITYKDIVVSRHSSTQQKTCNNQDDLQWIKLVLSTCQSYEVI